MTPTVEMDCQTPQEPEPLMVGELISIGKRSFEVVAVETHGLVSAFKLRPVRKKRAAKKV